MLGVPPCQDVPDEMVGYGKRLGGVCLANAARPTPTAKVGFPD